MKVYRVTTASNDYQRLVADDDAFWSRPELKRLGQPITDVWISPRCRVYNPLKTRGDFLAFASGTLCTTKISLEIVRSEFEAAGEILGLDVGGEEAFLLNILEVVDCIDADRSEWLVDRSGKKITLKNPVVRCDMLPESTLFKIAQQPGSVYVQDAGGDDGFYRTYHQRGMSGLKFEEVITSLSHAHQKRT